MNNSKLQKLLFVYNANTGLGNMLLDSAHKIISPATYACNLCDITYGAFTEKKKWKKYRQESKLEMDFLHKDEFKKGYASKFGHKFNFPIVLGITTQGVEILVNTAELNDLASAEDLIRLINERV